MSLAFVQRLRVRDGECDPQGVGFGASYLTEGLARGGVGIARDGSLAP